MATASLPLLPRNHSGYGAISSSPSDVQVMSQLERTATMRKIGLKACAILCCPLSFVCAMPPCNPCCRSGCGLDGERRDNQHIPYCEWTACKLNGVWNSRLAPKDCGELGCYVCDPCVLCFCCADEGLENYLLPAERNAYSQAEKRANRQLNFALAPPRQSMNAPLSQGSISPLIVHILKFFYQIPRHLQLTQPIDHATYQNPIPRPIVRIIFEFAESPPPPSNLRDRELGPPWNYSSVPPREFTPGGAYG